MVRLKRGDRVRHQAGWLATVTEVRLNSVVVVSDESRHLDGEYSSVPFELVADSTQPVVEDPTTEEQHEEPS